MIKEPQSGKQMVSGSRGLSEIRHGGSAGPPLNVALIKALGETPAWVTRLGLEKGEKKGCRIILCDAVKQIYLDLS